MTMAWRLVLVLLALALLPRPAAAEEVSACRAEAAWVTEDNDIRLAEDVRPAGRPEPLPPPVARRIEALIRAYYAPSAMQFSPRCDERYRGLYRVTCPGGLQLFVVRLKGPGQWGEYRLFLYDPARGRLSATARRVGLIAWKDRDLGTAATEPIVAVADLYGDGKKQVTFQERAHNGTFYDAVNRHYFQIRPDLELRRVLVIEEEASIPVLEPGRRGESYARRLAVLPGNRLRLDAEIETDDDEPSRRSVGYAILGSEGPGHAFHVVQRQPVSAMDDQWLVEMGGRSMRNDPDDDRFLREGCDQC